MSGKDHTIENILDELKPNTYLDATPHWERVEKGLKKMNRESLSSLWTLILGKKEKDRSIARSDKKWEKHLKGGD